MGTLTGILNPEELYIKFQVEISLNNGLELYTTYGGPPTVVSQDILQSRSYVLLITVDVRMGDRRQLSGSFKP